MPSDFAFDIILEGNFVIKSLQKFVDTLSDIALNDTGELNLIKKKVKNFVSSRFGYELSDRDESNVATSIIDESETGEYAPTVVSLD